MLTPTKFISISLLSFTSMLSSFPLLTSRDKKKQNEISYPVIIGADYLEINYKEYSSVKELIERNYKAYDPDDLYNCTIGQCGGFDLNLIEQEQHLPIFASNSKKKFSYYYPTVIIRYRIKPEIVGTFNYNFTPQDAMSINSILSTKIAFYSPSSLSIPLQTEILNDTYSTSNYKPGNYKFTLRVYDSYGNETLKDISIKITSPQTSHSSQSSQPSQSSQSSQTSQSSQSSHVPSSSSSSSHVSSSSNNLSSNTSFSSSSSNSSSSSQSEKEETKTSSFSYSLEAKIDQINSIDDINSILKSQENVDLYSYDDYKIIDDNIFSSTSLEGTYYLKIEAYKGNEIFSFDISIKLSKKKKSIFQIIGDFFSSIFKRIGEFFK